MASKKTPLQGPVSLFQLPRPHGRGDRLVLKDRKILASLALSTLLAMSCLSTRELRIVAEDGIVTRNTLENALPQTAVHDMVMSHMALATGKRPMVLVLGLDGTRPDALFRADRDGILEATLPGASFFHAFAGGYPSQNTVQATYTLPGFTSILTGTWAVENGVRGNGSGGKNPDVESFLGQIPKEYPGRRSSILAAWEAIAKVATAGESGIDNYVPDRGYYSGDYSTKDSRVTAETIRRVGEGFDCVFVVLDMVDHNGHLHGFSPEVTEYTAAIRRGLGMFRDIVEAVKNRATYEDEDWLIIITTDHGGKGLGHGGQSREERSTFILAFDSRGEVASPAQ